MKEDIEELISQKRIDGEKREELKEELERFREELVKMEKQMTN